MIRALVLFPLTMLATCSQQEAPAPAPTYVYRCPTLQQYSPAQQKTALSELQANTSKIPTLKEMLNDYNRLRKACGAMNQTAPPISSGIPLPAAYVR